MSKKQFSIFCITEGKQVQTGFQDSPPTTCPNNVAHEVRADTVTVVDDPRQDNLSAVSDPTVSDDINAGYGVGSRWVNVTTKCEFVCTNNSSGAAVWGIRICDWQSAESNDVSTTTSVSWQDKVVVTTAALTGTFLLLYSAELKSGSVDNKCKFRLRNTTDNLTLCNSNSAEDDYECVSSSSVVPFAGASKTFKLQFQSKVEGQTSYIQNARVRLWRVG